MVKNVYTHDKDDWDQKYEQLAESVTQNYIITGELKMINSYIYTIVLLLTLSW